MSQHKSTGPSTPEGKQRSSANARKHGFAGRSFIVDDAGRDAFDKFMKDWERDLQPRGAVEFELFGQITHAAWTLRRLSEAEAALIGESLADPLHSDDKAVQNKLRLFSIYRSRAGREFHKSLAELRKVQEESIFRSAVLPANQTVPVLPLTSVVRRTIIREQRLRGLHEWEQMKAEIDRPVPGQTKSFMTATPTR